jgi:hypothetical protein
LSEVETTIAFDFAAFDFAAFDFAQAAGGGLSGCRYPVVERSRNPVVERSRNPVVERSRNHSSRIVALSVSLWLIDLVIFV